MSAELVGTIELTTQSAIIGVAAMCYLGLVVMGLLTCPFF